MTFLGLWPVLGSNVFKTTALFLINFFTFKNCYINTENSYKNNSTTVLSSINTNITYLVEQVANKCSSEKETKVNI